MRLCKKIMLLLLPILVVMICLRASHQLDDYSTFLSKLATLPNLHAEILADLTETKTLFQTIPYSFNFTEWSFPSFNASSINEFFKSIGNFFSAFGTNLANLFTSLFNGLGTFFNAVGSVVKLIGNTLINFIDYILKLISILFAW